MSSIPDDNDKLQVEMNRNQALAFDPEYWEERAEAARTQAYMMQAQPVFASQLLKHAEDFDRLARAALKLRQQRRTLLGAEPRFRGAVAGNVVPLSEAKVG